jgi:glycine/D-amino acid oxidase-like deaminating enzyme
VNLPDKLPVFGRHRENSRLGVVNGLGAKGALFAPMLALEWVRLLRGEAPAHPEFRVERFWQ